MTLYKKSRWFILFFMIPHLLGCAITAAGGSAAAGATTLDRRTTGTIIEDQTIELKAYRSIKANEELAKKTHINITSYNTAVLITGESPLDEMRQEVISLVTAVEKVTHVYNEISIAAPSSMVSRSGDVYITTKVKAKSFEVNNIKISKPFQNNFNKNSVINIGFKKAFSELVNTLVKSSDFKKVDKAKLNAA